MANKYLDKIARSEDDTVAPKRIAGAGLILTGSSLIGNAYSNGELTGRETLYHGTSTERAESIRKRGLSPNKEGVSKVVEGGLHDANLNRVFLTRSSSVASGYAHQQDMVNEGIANTPGSFKDHKNVEEFNKRQHLTPGHDGVVKANIPTWKDEYRKTLNPELRIRIREANTKYQNLGESKAPTSVKKELFNTFQKDVHTILNEEGVPSDYIKGLGYKPNSFSEVKSFIKAKPNRFLKGIGKSVLGLGLVGAGGLLINNSLNKNNDQNN